MEHTSHPDAQWFPEAGLGMFVHWGISSVDATGELSWSMMEREGNESADPEAYFEQAERFDPENYDPDRWLAAAEQASMRYAILTAKHHDGFAMWPSEYGSFGTAEYCDGRDFVGEYVDACRRHCVKAGLYFSFPDWHHPSWPSEARETFDGLMEFTDETNVTSGADRRAGFDEYYQYIQGQLREVLTRYGDIDLLWFDTPDFLWAGTREDQIGDLYDLVRSVQPQVVVNGRGRYTHWGDYSTPENELPDEPIDGWWELCQTWGESWGYQKNDEYRDHTWTLERIAETVGRGGNLLLNVGPRADGTIPEDVYERLDELAAWMDHSGASVASVDGGPWPPRCTHPVTVGPSTWYVHLLDGETEVSVERVPAPRDIRLLRDGTALKYDHESGDLAIRVDAERRTPDDVVAISWDGTDCPGR